MPQLSPHNLLWIILVLYMTLTLYVISTRSSSLMVLQLDMPPTMKNQQIMYYYL